MKSGPHNPITSKENSIVKQVRALSDSGHRKEKRAFVIEGVKMVEEALGSGSAIQTIIAAPSLLRHHGKGIIKSAESRAIEIVWVSEKLLGSISENKAPQPVMAIAAMREHAEKDLLSQPSGLIVIAHQLQDPGNLGTIIRTAEAAGAAGVVITPNTVDPYNTKAVQASMGSILRVPVVRVGAAAAYLRTCSQAGMQTAAMALSGETNLFDLDLRRPTAVIVGQEGSGLPKDIQEAAEHRVRIPMAGSVDSLNAATSVAVLLFEAMRQRLPR